MSDQAPAEPDPPYLAELIARRVMANYPGLTSEKAREILLAFGA